MRVLGRFRRGLGAGSRPLPGGVREVPESCGARVAGWFREVPQLVDLVFSCNFNCAFEMSLLHLRHAQMTHIALIACGFDLVTPSQAWALT